MDPFEIFVWVFRGVALVIIAVWARGLWMSRDKPPEWIAPNPTRGPFELRRDRYRLAAVLGIVAGVGLLIFSVFMPSIL